MQKAKTDIQTLRHEAIEAMSLLLKAEQEKLKQLIEQYRYELIIRDGIICAIDGNAEIVGQLALNDEQLEAWLGKHIEQFRFVYELEAIKASPIGYLPWLMTSSPILRQQKRLAEAQARQKRGRCAMRKGAQIARRS